MTGNYDMSNCLIDFTSCPKGVKLVEHFPELSAFEEFTNTFNDNEIRIAIAISDLNSPFLKIKEPDIRIKALFEFLDIGLKTKSNQELFEQVIQYKHSRIIDACCRHIQRQNNHVYASWWTLNIAFYDLQREAAIPRTSGTGGKDAITAAKDKSFFAQEMDKIASKLAEYEPRIFKDTKLKQAAVDRELKKLVTFPEKFADTHPGFPNDDADS